MSGYLYKFTGNATYLDAATSSHQFIRSHFLEPNGDYVVAQSDIDLLGCQFNNAEGSAYSTGLYLEALSMLSNITGDTEIANLSAL